jgi:copper(I)-binding protein
MDLTRALKPGETVTIKLEMEDGSTTEIDATVKKFTGAEEKYQNDDITMGDDMDMGSGS